MKTKEPMTKEDRIKIAGYAAIIVGLMMFFGALIAVSFSLHPLFGIFVTGGVLSITGCIICSASWHIK